MKDKLFAIVMSIAVGLMMSGFTMLGMMLQGGPNGA